MEINWDVINVIILNLLRQLNELDSSDEIRRLRQVVIPYDNDKFLKKELMKINDKAYAACIKKVRFQKDRIRELFHFLKSYSNGWKLNDTLKPDIKLSLLIKFYTTIKETHHKLLVNIKILTTHMMTHDYWEQENYCNDCFKPMEYCYIFNCRYLCSRCGHKLCSSCNAIYTICFKCVPKNVQDEKRQKMIEEDERKEKERIERKRLEWNIRWENGHHIVII